MKRLERTYRELAQARGFEVGQTAKGHWRFTRAGCPDVIAPGSPSDNARNEINTRKQLDRALRGIGRGYAGQCRVFSYDD